MIIITGVHTSHNPTRVDTTTKNAPDPSVCHTAFKPNSHARRTVGTDSRHRPGTACSGLVFEFYCTAVYEHLRDGGGRRGVA